MAKISRIICDRCGNFKDDPKQTFIHSYVIKVEQTPVLGDPAQFHRNVDLCTDCVDDLEKVIYVYLQPAPQDAEPSP